MNNHAFEDLKRKLRWQLSLRYLDKFLVYATPSTALMAGRPGLHRTKSSVFLFLTVCYVHMHMDIQNIRACTHTGGRDT